MDDIRYDQNNSCNNLQINSEDATYSNSAETLPQHYFPRIQWVDNDTNEDEDNHISGQEDEVFSRSGLPRCNAQFSGLYRMVSFSPSFENKQRSNSIESENFGNVPIVYGQASAALGIPPSPICEEDCSLTNQLLDSHLKSWKHFVIPNLDQIISLNSKSFNLAY